MGEKKTDAKHVGHSFCAPTEFVKLITELGKNHFGCEGRSDSIRFFTCIGLEMVLKRKILSSKNKDIGEIAIQINFMAEDEDGKERMKKEMWGGKNPYEPK